MKRLLAALLSTLLLACVLMAALPVSAGGDTGVLVCHENMAFSPDWGYWRGTINGPIHGTVGFWELPNVIQDGKEYFVESFVIATDNGVLQGRDEGVYDLTTGEFWAHGLVEDATGRWAYLEGYTIFEWGMTSTPFVFPMTAKNIPVVLVPPQPTPAHDHDIGVTYSDLAFGPWGYWRGDVSGDLQGTEQIWEQSNYLIGDELYFFENSTTRTTQGVVEVEDHGIFNLTSGNFWAIGQVTDASGRYHFLEGYTFMGFGIVANVGGEVMTTYAPGIFLDG